MPTAAPPATTSRSGSAGSTARSATTSFWEPLDHTHRLGPRTPPTSFVSGWYDFMLDQLLRDYETLTDAGGTPRLTVGPWWHVSPELQYEGMRDTLTWMNAELRGDPSGLRDKPVRLFIGGRNEWRDFDAYPPGAPDIQIWHLHPGQGAVAAPGRMPRRPTATPTIRATRRPISAAPCSPSPAPVRSTRRRSKTGTTFCVFTSEPLFADLTIIGNVRAVIYARASLPERRSLRASSATSTRPAARSTSATASSARPPPIPRAGRHLEAQLQAPRHRPLLRRDHRLRLIVASGAHPRYARNTGTDEPFGTATTLRTVDLEIFHDPDHPSAIHLPVYRSLN